MPLPKSFLNRERTVLQQSLSWFIATEHLRRMYIVLDSLGGGAFAVLESAIKPVNIGYKFRKKDPMWFSEDLETIQIIQKTS